MAGIKNGVLAGKNADFTQDIGPNAQTSESNGLVTDGKIWIGSTALNIGSTHINVGSLTSPLGTLTIGYSSPNITLDITGGSSAVEHLTGDTGGQLDPVANNFFILASTLGPGTTPIQVNGSGNTLVVNVQRSQAIATTNSTNVGLAAFKSNDFTVDTNGFVALANGGDLHVAKLIVNSTANAGGNYTTITAALAAAVSGDTIFVMPGATGTYTENLTLKAGVNITAFNCDSGGESGTIVSNVKIIGKMTASFNGACSISGIAFQTNTDNILTVTSTSTINFDSCMFNVTNATGINMSAAGVINIFYSRGALSGGSAFFSITSGALKIYYSDIATVSDAIASNVNNGGNLDFYQTTFHSAITNTTGAASFQHCFMSTQNTTSLTLNDGASADIVFGCRLESGTASSISIGAGTSVPVMHSTFKSSNTNVLTGAGELKYALLAFYGSSSGTNVTTQTPLATLI